MKKMKQIMKDEEGLTLVELLAVVVIMAIIAGIAAVSISKVIQRSREDAQVSNVQQMLATGNIKSVDFADKPEAITFEKDEKGVISVKVGAEALSAGKEKNVEKTFSEENSGSIKREDLFPKSDTPKS
jgi:type IV pilus assembly protein PilA